MKMSTPFLIVSAALAVVSGVASAAERDLSCSLKFALQEWSALV